MANIIDSYSETNQNSFTKTATTNFVGQSFTGNGSTLGSAQLYISKLGSPTGNANAKIYAHSGTFGTSSIPTGSALATSDNFDVSTLTTSFQLITFNFSGGNQIALSNGTHYVLTIEYTGGAYVSDAVKVGYDTTSPTHGGNDSFTSDATTWFSEAFDLCFYIYDNAGSVILPLNFLKTPTLMVLR